MSSTTTTATRPIGRRLARMAGAAVAIGVLLTGCLTSGQQEDFDLVNAKRKANAKSTLTVDDAAVRKAQAWSDSMARKGVLEHTGGGSKLSTTGISGWCAYGENVGKGSSVQAIHDAMWRSSAHKANILGNYRTLGTGVTKSGSTYWVTEIYVRYC